MSSTAEPRTPSTAALQIEPLATPGAMQACVRLQRLAWGYADLDVVPVNELLSVARSGGIVLGAFTEEDGARRCVGFCFGLLGRDPDTGELYHASRMLAVDPAWRGRGVGRRLKRAQREHARAQGLRSMRWTFDPLQLGNAWLNLEVLGAVGVRYHRDLFGPATSSPLHAVGTDRLEVHWSLEDEQRPDFVPARRVPLPW
ncbi:MAG: GNAT family N-acetyltransferase, partial [Planctomycetota bacterium]